MKYRKDCRLKVLQNFHKQCSMGSMSIGDVGEKVASLIFLLSFDDNRPGESPKVRPIRVFLGTLYRNDFFQLTVNYIEDDEDMKSLLNDGYVFFNHFARQYAQQAKASPTSDNCSIHCVLLANPHVIKSYFRTQNQSFICLYGSTSTSEYASGACQR